MFAIQSLYSNLQPKYSLIKRLHDNVHNKAIRLGGFFSLHSHAPTSNHRLPRGEDTSGPPDFGLPEELTPLPH